jgi:hypothetical protein
MSSEQFIHPLEKIIAFHTSENRDPQNLSVLVRPFLIAFAAQAMCILPKNDFNIDPGNIGYRRYSGIVNGLDPKSYIIQTDEEWKKADLVSMQEVRAEVKALKTHLQIDSQPRVIVAAKGGLYEQVWAGNNHRMHKISPTRLIELVDDLIAIPAQPLPEPFMFDNFLQKLHGRKDKDDEDQSMNASLGELGMLGVVLDKFGMEMVHMDAEQGLPTPKQSEIEDVLEEDFPKITCTLEAGVLLTEHPPQVVQRYYAKAGDIEVPTSKIVEANIKGGVTKVLKILNTPADNQVTVEEVRLVANLLLTESLVYNPKTKDWFYKGGLTSENFLGGDLSNQVTPILDGMAKCWQLLGKDDKGKLNIYGKKFSFYGVQGTAFTDDADSGCKGCKLKEICPEYFDHKRPQDPEADPQERDIPDFKKDKLYQLVEDYLSDLHQRLYEKVSQGYIYVYLPLWGPKGKLVEGDIAPFHSINRDEINKPEVKIEAVPKVEPAEEVVVDIADDQTVSGSDDTEDDSVIDSEDQPIYDTEPVVVVANPRNLQNPYADFEDIPDVIEDSEIEEGDEDLDVYGNWGNFGETVKPRVIGGDDGSFEVTPTPQIEDSYPDEKEYGESRVNPVVNKGNDLKPRVLGEPEKVVEVLPVDDDLYEEVEEPVEEREEPLEPVIKPGGNRRNRPAIDIRVEPDFDPDNPPERQRPVSQKAVKSGNSNTRSTSPIQSFGSDELEVPSFLSRGDGKTKPKAEPQPTQRSNRQLPDPDVRQRPVRPTQPSNDRVKPEKSKSSGGILSGLKILAGKVVNQQQPAQSIRFNPSTHESQKWTAPVTETKKKKGDLFDKLDGAIGGIGNFDPLSRKGEVAGLFEADGKVNLGVLKKNPDHPLAQRLDGMKRKGSKITGVYRNPDGSYEIITEKSKQQVRIFGEGDGGLDDF